MPHTDTYSEKRTDAQTSSLNLLDVIAYSRSTTGGLATFMAKTLFISTSLATAGGITGVMLFAPFLGPVIPFLSCSLAGFGAGIAQRWMFDRQEAIDALREYPELMEFHLRQLPSTASSTAGTLHKGVSFSDWMRDIDVHRGKQCMAVIALYSSANSIQEYKKLEEKAILERMQVASRARLSSPSSTSTGASME